MKGKRTDRLNSEFRKLIYDVIKNRINSPDITEMFSVTEVDVSPDLKHAKVYVSVYSTSEERAKATLDGICKASPEIRKELAHASNIRYVPELRFYRDGASAYGSKIDKILSTFTYSTSGDENDDNGDSK